MSTEPPSTPDPYASPAPTTDVAARRGSDPWADDDTTSTPAPTTLVQRQFDPYSLARLRNLMDDENAYCN